MMTTCTIRRAAPEDLDVVLNLLAMQFDDHDIGVASDDLRTTIDTMLRDANKGIFVLAFEDTMPIGVAAMPITWTLEHGGKCIWLDELFVLPEYRNRNTGAALLAEGERLARECGCRAVDLEVDAGHRRAESLYARNGYQRHDRNRWFKKLP